MNVSGGRRRFLQDNLRGIRRGGRRQRLQLSGENVFLIVLERACLMRFLPNLIHCWNLGRRRNVEGIRRTIFLEKWCWYQYCGSESGSTCFWASGSGSTPKCHGSATLVGIMSSANIISRGWTLSCLITMITMLMCPVMDYGNYRNCSATASVSYPAFIEEPPQ